MIAIKPSRAYLFGMIVVAFGALVAICVSHIPVWIKACAIALEFVYAYHIWKKTVANKHQDHVVGVKHVGEGSWTLFAKSGKEISVTLEGSSVRSQFFLLLNFKTQEGARVNLTIFRDCVSADGFRQLSKVLILQ